MKMKVLLGCLLLLLQEAVAQNATNSSTLWKRGSKVRVWYCDDVDKGLTTDHRMRIVLFGDADWDDPGNCDDTSDTAVCSDLPTLLDAQQVHTFTYNDADKYGVYYECNSGLSFLSGNPGRLTQCVAGSWTTIDDICLEDCDLPRDCCAVAEKYGFSNSDGQEYLVSPSNNTDDDDDITVKCDLGDTPDSPDGSWTLVLQHYASSNLHLTLQQYIDGHGNPSDTGSYFIGLKNLVAFNWDDSTERPLVMKLMMEASSANLYASYGDVVITKDTFTLQRLGTYHGNAGDNLADSIGKKFCEGVGPNDTDPCWWGGEDTGRNSFLTSATPIWGTTNLISVTVWVRPKYCDEVHCPDDYVMAVGGTVCFYFSDVPATNHMDALARRDGDVYPSIIGSFSDHNFACNDDRCPTKKREMCVLLRDGGFYSEAWCNLDSRYFACQMPVMCPPDYTAHKSRCYKVMEMSNSTFLNALDSCNFDGAALAYPQDENIFNFITQLVKMQVNSSLGGTVNLALGYNTVWENMTIDNMYTSVTTEVNTLMNSVTRTPGYDYTFLNLQLDSLNWNLIQASDADTTSYAICEFRGPLGCWNDIPTPLNMSVTYSLNANRINQKVTYTCTPGYFVNGQVGNNTPQYRYCHGQLGGWMPRDQALVPCIGVDVCNEDFPPKLADMDLNEQRNPRYETHTLKYQCKYPDMTNQAGLRDQILTCTPYNGTEFNSTHRYVPDNVTVCDRCFRNPDVRNAVTNFSTQTMYLIGDTLIATCDYSHRVAHQVDTQVVNCTNNGWQKLPCQKVCLLEPVVINATTDWEDNMWTVGETVKATCKDDLYFAILKSQTHHVKCTDSGWSSDPYCQQVCLDTPYVANATVNLEDKMWVVGSAPMATCNSQHMFIAEKSNTKPLPCTSQGWQQVTGCDKVCENPEVEGAIMSGPSEMWPVGVRVNFTCSSGYSLIPSGDTVQQVLCADDGWKSEPCQKLCQLEPEVINATTDWQDDLWPVGTAVNAACEGDLIFVGDRSNIRPVFCTDTGWENEPACEEKIPSVLCSLQPQVGNASTTWDNITWWVGGVITATCDHLHYFLNGSTKETQLTCTTQGWENITGCEKILSVACNEEPLVVNATTTWVNRTWWVGEEINITCNSDHKFIPEDTYNQLMECSEDDNIGENCYVPPVIENGNSAWVNRTWLVRETVVATCSPQHIFVAENATERHVVCTDYGWENVTACEKVCEGEPTVEGATTDWSLSGVWMVGTIVNATCISGHYLIPSGDQVQIIQCTDDGWDNGTTACMEGCVDKPDFGNVTSNWVAKAWKTNENVTVSCPDQHFTRDRLENTSFTCTSDGWVIDYPCIKACEGNPSVVNANVSWVEGIWLEGEKVTAICNEQHHVHWGTISYTIPCTSEGWDNSTTCVFCKYIYNIVQLFSHKKNACLSK
ncbi:Coagulation factor XIII B chain-like [Homarus americanus]|uniref:Coagulation factor XIII B chain-like n=1 Tax=Homarus americanus TaxID=6706 RepID=A0A8J5N0Q1_HOMAM|nr:Coagulation factor XIII B chain-like [Homarus americanus]